MEDRNMPATKADLEALEARQNERTEALEARQNERTKALEARLNERHDMLRSEMQHTHRDLIEAIRDGQTEVLKAFYSFAESNNKRVMEIESDQAAIRSRLGTLEDRLLEVEKRLNMPPTQ